MHKRDIPIETPCGVDWSSMNATEGRARLCASCDKVVHDVSEMDPAEVRAVLDSGPACVRYLYDAHGEVFSRSRAVPNGAQIVPASMLLSKVAGTMWLAAASLVGTVLVFEACGGNRGRSDSDIPTRAHEMSQGPATPYVRGANPAGPPDTPMVPDAGNDAM